MDDLTEDSRSTKSSFDEVTSTQPRGAHKNRSRRRTKIKRSPMAINEYKTDAEGHRWELSWSRDKSSPVYHRWIMHRDGAFIGDTFRRPSGAWDKIVHTQAPFEPRPLLKQLSLEHEFLQDLKTMEFWIRARG